MIDQKIGPYLIRELINEGGTAALYAAARPDGETVAIRVLLPQHRFSWRQRGMFNRGTKIHSRLKSEHVVQFIESGSHSFRPYSVMEFVKGTNLRFVILRQGEQLAQYRFSVVLDMARALLEVHDKGYVHLDIKPENFLVTPYWRIKLTDFDLCEPMKDGKKLRKKILQGTVNYLAPELIEKQEFDQRADIFAFGIAAYEVLSGGKRPTDRILSNSPEYDLQVRPLTECTTGIPKSIDKIILKCLASDPAERYFSTLMLVKTLEKEVRSILSPPAQSNQAQ